MKNLIRINEVWNLRVTKSSYEIEWQKNDVTCWFTNSKLKIWKLSLRVTNSRVELLFFHFEVTNSNLKEKKQN